MNIIKYAEPVAKRGSRYSGIWRCVAGLVVPWRFVGTYVSASIRNRQDVSKTCTQLHILEYTNSSATEEWNRRPPKMKFTPWPFRLSLLPPLALGIPQLRCWLNEWRKNVKEGNVIPVHVMKAYKGRRWTTPLIPILRMSRPLYPRETTPLPTEYETG